MISNFNCTGEFLHNLIKLGPVVRDRRRALARRLDSAVGSRMSWAFPEKNLSCEIAVPWLGPVRAYRILP